MIFRRLTKTETCIQYLDIRWSNTSGLQNTNDHNYCMTRIMCNDLATGNWRDDSAQKAEMSKCGTLSRHSLLRRSQRPWQSGVLGDRPACRTAAAGRSSDRQAAVLFRLFAALGHVGSCVFAQTTSSENMGQYHTIALYVYITVASKTRLQSFLKESKYGFPSILIIVELAYQIWRFHNGYGIVWRRKVYYESLWKVDEIRSRLCFSLLHD